MSIARKESFDNQPADGGDDVVERRAQVRESAGAQGPSCFRSAMDAMVARLTTFMAQRGDVATNPQHSYGGRRLEQFASRGDERDIHGIGRAQLVDCLARTASSQCSRSCGGCIMGS